MWLDGEGSISTTREEGDTHLIMSTRNNEIKSHPEHIMMSTQGERERKKEKEGRGPARPFIDDILTIHAPFHPFQLSRVRKLYKATHTLLLVILNPPGWEIYSPHIHRWIPLLLFNSPAIPPLIFLHSWLTKPNGVCLELLVRFPASSGPKPSVKSSSEIYESKLIMKLIIRICHHRRSSPAVLFVLYFMPAPPLTFYFPDTTTGCVRNWREWGQWRVVVVVIVLIILGAVVVIMMMSIVNPESFNKRDLLFGTPFRRNCRRLRPSTNKLS